MITPDPEKQCLPKHLAKKLPADLRDALQHPYRRRILRTLHRDVQRLSPSELATSGLVPCSVSCISYHMLALSSSGLIREDGTESVGGSRRRYFSSSVTDEHPVLGVLRDTEASDNRFLSQPDTK